MRQQRISLVSLIAALCLVAAACGSTEATSSSATSTVPTSAATGGDVDLSAPISEQDLAQARAVLGGARATWTSLDPFAYTMTVGFESINALEIDFDAGGNAVEERVLFGDPNEQGWGVLPRSVPEAFDVVDKALAQFESGEFEVPPGGDCGNHLNAEFDERHGSPTYFDTLGPCDSGVGLRIVITPEGEDLDESDVPAPLDECDQGAFVGKWLSPRAAGTEPLADDDGVGDEGGSGVVALTLNEDTRGNGSIQNADTIEVFGEWFCTSTTIFGITDNGDEITLATINDDGTLTAGNQTLTKVDAG